MQTPIRVFIVDDHQLFIDGLKSLLGGYPEIEVIGEANDGDVALEKIKSQAIQADVMLLDIEMENMNGVLTLEQLKHVHNKPKVLILTMYNKKEFIVKLMDLGADGYILKNKSKEELVGAIHSVFAGNPYYSLAVLKEATRPTEAKPEYDENLLTKREKEILRHMADGLNSREIGEQLHISTTTVNTHRRNMLHKLGYKNSNQLISFAYETGIYPGQGG